MLTEEDFARFKEFRCTAMGNKLREIIDDPAYDSMTFEEKVKEMIDAQVNAKVTNKIQKLNKAAGFKLADACVEEIVYLPERTLSKDRITRLASCKWVEDNEVVAIISKTGCGKSYIAQALGNAACRNLHSVRYRRLADIFADLNQARAACDGSYYERMDEFKTVRVLIMDDFMTTPITTENAIDLFEILEAREGTGATLIASQLEPHEWYLRIEGELMADSILGRTGSTARYLDLDGPNMRECFAKKKQEEEASTN